MRVFDSTSFLNKPAMPVSFTALPFVNENFIYDGTTLNETKLKKYIKDNLLLQFDTERENHTPAALRNLQQTAFQLGPAQHGFFGMPAYQYDMNQEAFDLWVAEYKDVLDNVDAFFPEMYTYATDPVEWGKRLDFMLANLKPIANGRPIYPFLWFIFPYRAPSLPVFIGPRFWQYQLNACRKSASGAVIWGGYLQQWDENAEWWQIVKQYL